MHGSEQFFGSSYDGCIYDSVAYHLIGAVKSHQSSGIRCGNGKARAHETVLVADEAAGRAIHSPEEGRIINCQSPRFDLILDGLLRFGRELDHAFLTRKKYARLSLTPE